LQDKALQALAGCRYPALPLAEAVERFCADRTRAGLGALDESLRSRRGWVRNCKWMHPASGRVVYELRIERPDYFVPDPSTERMALFGETETKTLSLRRVPGRSAHRNLTINRGDLRDQASRGFVAQSLLALRMELRSLATNDED
jgi:hypothetical protein